ncbi:MAG: nucleotidyltransferase family protein [Gemmatimonadota bacterium]|nr:nucleotidyltransferase family protein [Gemmatimonadota bacterium]
MSDAARASPSALELACAVARARLDERAAARRDAAVAGVADWREMPPLLARHGLLALAAGHLAPARADIPESVWLAIEAEARAARARALAGAAELCRLARACEEAGIPMLAIKGPVLAQRAYGDIGARAFTDLDLLVAPGAVPGALALLGELGYAPEYRFTPRRDAWFRHVDGDYPLIHGQTGQLVELHARPLSRRFVGMAPFEALWERRMPVTLGDRPIAALGDDDAFLLQALHGGKHRWERLEWVAATGQLLRRRGGDARAVLEAAPAARRAVLVACHVAAQWVEAPLSVPMRDACRRDPAVARLADRAWRRIASGARDEGSGETAGKLRFNYRLQGGVAARLRFAYRWAFWPSPEDWGALSLPDWLFVAYRVVRPVRLLARYLRPARPRETPDG